MKKVKKEKEPTLAQLEKRKKRNDQEFQRFLKQLTRKLDTMRDPSAWLLTAVNGEKIN